MKTKVLGLLFWALALGVGVLGQIRATNASPAAAAAAVASDAETD